MILTPLQVQGATNQNMNFRPIIEIDHTYFEKISDSYNSYDFYLYANEQRLELMLLKNIEIIYHSSTHIQLLDTLTSEIEVLPTRVV